MGSSYDLGNKQDLDATKGVVGLATVALLQLSRRLETFYSDLIAISANEAIGQTLTVASPLAE